MRELLQDSDVLPSTVIGFPHGGHTTRVKVAEAQQALDNGGRELDMVVNISKVLSGDWRYVRDEFRAVLDPTHGRRGKLKVIFENCYLQQAHKVRLCEICGELGRLGQDLNRLWPRRSHRGERAADAQHCPPQMQVKAAGGIRTLQMALLLHDAGATRLGCSKTAEVLEECRRQPAA